MSVGEKIKVARKGKNMSQKELAEILKVSEVMVSQYERGVKNPKIETIQKIASALSVPLSDILDWDIEQREQNISEDFVFESYLSTLGYVAELEVTKWHWEDENAKPEDKAQIPDECEYTLIKDGITVIFSKKEFDDLQSATKDVIETRFYKKVIEAERKKQQKPPPSANGSGK